ncbi:MAG: hypothetical protein R2830_07790 [Saprospiraceae bacterium]
MEQPASTVRPFATNGQAYLPLNDFIRHLSESAASPYHSTFSFQPFLEKLKANSQKSGGTSAPFLKTLETELADTEALLQSPGQLASLMAILFPALFTEGQMAFVSKPFSNDFLCTTKAFQEMAGTGQWEINMAKLGMQGEDKHGATYAGNLVLNAFYDMDTDCSFAETLRLRNTATGLEKHFRINILTDFVKVHAVKPLKKLSKKDIHHLLDRWDDEALWLQMMPVENFSSEGFVIGYLSDVTQRETLSIIESLMANESGNSDHRDELGYQQHLIRSFLSMPEVTFGTLQVRQHYWQEGTSWSLLRRFDAGLVRPDLKNPKSIYGKVVATGKATTVTDLPAVANTDFEMALAAKGFRSLLLAPISIDDKGIEIIFELASPKPFRFSQLTVQELKEIFALYTVGTNKFVQDIGNKVRLTIQQQFTSIHPSVEWKFREAATKFYWDREVDSLQTVIPPIIFNEVYPLYGQADIVSSSKQRNESIIADLIDNLERLGEVLKFCGRAVVFHLLDVYLEKISTCLARLRAGEFISSDESEIVDLLTREIHPLLRSLEGRFPQLNGEKLNSYFDYLDTELGIVYRRRKAYEESVSMLVETLADHLDGEDRRMQEVLPHYFEKYKTDGVEYNIYIGASLLEKGEFSPFFLKNFRLWQLIHFCEITRLVAQRSKELPVPLTTAQLIFAYSNPLSIRFRMDEKQFDVDGAYNVRYAILKKRIDKAVIKGTSERLTQSGKIAIVWLNEKDRLEYLEYLHHLQNRGLIAEEIEDLELEKLQGAEGLKALRVTVRV